MKKRKKNTQIKNLSIGWVVEVIVDKYQLTPGYNPVRKIIYKDYEEIGSDLLNDNKGLPIIYPIVDFRNPDLYSSLENGEYVIMPCSTITSYLEAFKISTTSKLGLFQKRIIKNLVFGNSCVVNEPLFISRKIDLEKYNQEVEKLGDFKVYHGSNIPTDSEYSYLEAISIKGEGFQKTL